VFQNFFSIIIEYLIPSDSTRKKRKKTRPNIFPRSCINKRLKRARLLFLSYLCREIRRRIGRIWFYFKPYVEPIYTTKGLFIEIRTRRREDCSERFFKISKNLYSVVKVLKRFLIAVGVRNVFHGPTGKTKTFKLSWHCVFSRTMIDMLQISHRKKNAFRIRTFQ